MNKARILIVEDEAIIAMDIESILREYGYRIAGIVVTGEESLAAAKAHTPDLILMDILLAGRMDGIEAARLIRRSFDIPVIYVSANADEATVERARDTEPYGYINKPINRKDLYSNIESALYKHAMEKRLRASEERYRDLVENINDVIFTLDTEGVFTYISPVIRRMGKYEEAEVIGKHFSNFIHPGDLEGLYASVQRTIAGNLEPYEYRLLDKDGRVVCIRTSSRPIMKDGAYAGMTGIITDISERRLSEAALREREARLDSILRTSPIGIGLSMDRIILVANDRLCGMTGYSREELIGQSSLMLFPAGEFERVGQEKIAQVERTGIAAMESRLRRKDGTEIDVILSASPLEPGNPSAGDSFMVMDITERKKSEAALREREARLDSILRAAPIGIGVVIDRVIMQANDRLCEMTGYSREELVGQSALMLYPTREEYEFVGREKYAQIAEAGTGTVETRWRRKDDAVIDVLLSSSPIEPGNLPEGVSFTAMDITRRKKTEEAIRQSEERYRRIVETTVEGVLWMDPGLRITYANQRMAEMLGYTQAEMLGRPMTDFMFEEDVGAHHQAEGRMLGARAFFERRFRRRDGGRLWAIVSAAPIMEERGDSGGVLAMFTDITHLKETEGLLRESEERFRAIFEGSFTPMALCDLKGRFLEVNDALCEMTGYSRRELQGRSYRAITYPDDLKLGTRHMQGLLKGEQGHFHLEQRYLRKDGGIIWAIMSASIINDTAGAPHYFSMQIVDITARKAAEGAIKKTQYLLSESQRMAGMGSVEFNSRTGEIYCTDETYRILGVESDGRPLAAKEFARLLHPDDAEAFNDSLRDCLRGNKKLDLAYRIIRPDGALRHVKSLGNAIRERDGKAVMMIGTIMDITEQVRAEELIKNSLREKEIMLREIHHRVKNNFQFLISILDIQSERLSDPAALSIFSNARNRIRLISMVHEKLYQAKDLSHIDIADYIRSLVDYLRQSMSERPGKVTISLRVKDVELGINRAMTCGLIINELVSNTLKHAYPHGGRVKIRIEFSPTGKEYMLRISDGGVGFPRGLDFRATASLGMQLVCMFVEQLGGGITLIRRKGTEFRITFPKNK